MHSSPSRQSRSWLLSLGAVLVALAPLAAQDDEPDYPRLAPYADIVWSAGVPSVLVDGGWFDLVAIDGRPVAEIVAFSREEYGESWQKRFDEDLVELLSAMGHRPADTVLLTVRSDAGDHDVAAAMTEVNRALIMRAKRAREEAAARPERLDGSAALEDIDAFERGLRHQFAYLEANDPPFGAALAALRARARDGIPTDSLGIELERIIGLFIDGHAGVSGHERGDRFLPFVVDVADAGRFVAVRAGTGGPLDREHPYLSAIDGRPLRVWLDAADPYIPRGSPQYRAHMRARLLRDAAFIRAELGVRTSDSLTVTLADAGGETVERTLSLSDERPRYAGWPIAESRILEGDVGYLRIPAMDDDGVEAIREWMPRFADTRGLVIDVRGNGGGSRDALLELSAWLMRPDEAPRVVNIAAYRLAPEFDDDHLEARFMYPADDPRWTEPERAAIAAARERFEPEWSPPAGLFSEWHYLVLSSDPSGTRPTYERPVVVLLDGWCFSATDIFLGALKGWRGVTLVGTPSGGGSARSQRFELPNSLLDVQVASMASFRADGRLYDTRGIEPDVIAEPTASYHAGVDDPALEAALEIIEAR